MVHPAKTELASLHFLILSAEPTEAATLAAWLAGGAAPVPFRAVTDAAGLRAALRERPWDVLLYLFGRPALTAPAAMKILDGQGCDLPFIIVADPADEKAALRAMRGGAHDVVFRDRLDRLLPAIEREVREARQRADHHAALAMAHDSDARFRGLASSLPGMAFHLQRLSSGEHRFLYVSEGCHALFGLKQHELLASPRKFFEAFEADDRRQLEAALAVSADSGAPLDWAGRLRGRGRGKWVDLRSTPQRGDEGSTGIVSWQGIATNITAIKETEAALRASREQLSELSFHLEAAREQERERIARDIHDELGSLLVRLKIEATLMAGKLPAADQDRARRVGRTAGAAREGAFHRSAARSGHGRRQPGGARTAARHPQGIRPAGSHRIAGRGLFPALRHHLPRAVRRRPGAGRGHVAGPVPHRPGNAHQRRQARPCLAGGGAADARKR
jgi:PAS domain S-box-containing protein